MTLPSIVAESRKYAPETIKTRARAVLLLAVERMSDALTDDANALTLNELSQATNSLGRIAGIADEEHTGTVTIRVVRDDAPAPLADGSQTPYLRAGGDEVADAQVVDVSEVARDGVPEDGVGGVPSGDLA